MTATIPVDPTGVGAYLGVDRVPLRAPSPSLLTAARDRSADQFGAIPGDTIPQPPARTDEPIPIYDTDAGTLDPRVSADPWSMRLPRWRSGIQFNAVLSQPSFGWPRCPSPGQVRHAPVQLTKPVHFHPFVIYTPLEADWVMDGEFIATAATDLTEVHTAAAIASALWMGQDVSGNAVYPDETSLATASLRVPTMRRFALDATPTPGTAVDLDDAVSVLLDTYENATSGAGGQLLHIPQFLTTQVLGGVPGGASIARTEGNIYRGPAGSIVSPGPGYPGSLAAITAGANGSGPLTSAQGVTPETYAGATAGNIWVYITGPVEYALEDVSVVPFEEAERRNFFRTNTYEVWADRLAILRFDPSVCYACLALIP